MEALGPSALPAVVERYARVLADCGAELGDRPLVLPTAEFFPDAFQGDEASTARLVERMMEHAGMHDIPVSTRVVDGAGDDSSHACSNGCAVPKGADGAAPRLVDTGEEWWLQIPQHELGHPVVLTAMVARALGHVFLVETLPDGARIEAPADLTADYAAVALGFGPLLLEGAYLYSKGCGGPRVAQVTRAGLTELALVAALFIELGGHPPRKVLRELGATQQAALREALEWSRSNPALVERLRRDPHRVAAGDLALEPARPWLLRLFARKGDTEAVLQRAPRSSDARPPAEAEKNELRALVEEALGVDR